LNKRMGENEKGGLRGGGGQLGLAFAKHEVLKK